VTRQTERFLVTGAGGCIGAWTVRLLRDAGVDVIASDLTEDLARFDLVSLDRGDRPEFLRLDVTDGAAVRRAVDDLGVTHIVHLAGLQVPACAADPPLGAMVNVVGTVNLFDAVSRTGRRIGLCYASSAAVFGRSTNHPAGLVGDASPPRPETHYGVFKVANEASARIYAADHGVGSIGLRPFTVYGPGRDQGRTSGPTIAMLAAAAGVRYSIPLGGAMLLTHAADCAQCFIDGARAAAASSDAICLNVPGIRSSAAAIVDLIEKEHPEAKGLVDICEATSLTPALLAHPALPNALESPAPRPLEQGVRETIQHFRRALDAGLVGPPAG
jgi:nucleoside-diphosphate-sugar epimerase